MTDKDREDTAWREIAKRLYSSLRKVTDSMESANLPTHVDSSCDMYETALNEINKKDGTDN